MLWRREVSLGSVYQEVYETEVSSFRSRRLVGGIKTRSDEGSEVGRGRRVGWTSVPRIAYDIVPPTLRGFVRFTFSSIACLPSRRSSQLSVPFPTR